MTLGIPRDRNAEFEPQIVKRRQTRLAGLDTKVLALYARGMTVRDIQAQLEEIYGVEISPALISNVTDAVLEDVAAWQTRPLDEVYPIVWFDGYDCIYAGGKVLEVACWAHARRKFFDAQGSNSTACKEVLDLIWKLFELERKIADSSPEQRVEKRQAEAKPVLCSIKAFLDKQKLIALPKSALGKAVSYALNNWSALNIYTDHGALTIDNNQSERALRSMAVGRKNWLFMGSARGGRTNAIIASLIATCKAHDVHPRLYLEDVLTRLARGETDFENLMPDRWQPQTT